MSATALYKAVMEQLELQRQRRRIPMWRLDDLAGTSDGYYAKILHCDTPSGKQARFETLQLIVDALFPGGVRLRVVARRKSLPEPARISPKKLRYVGKTKFSFDTRRKLKAHLREIASSGGKARQAQLAAQERQEWARQANSIRWGPQK